MGSTLESHNASPESLSARSDVLFGSVALGFGEEVYPTYARPRIAKEFSLLNQNGIAERKGFWANVAKLFEKELDSSSDLLLQLQQVMSDINPRAREEFSATPKIGDALHLEEAGATTEVVYLDENGNSKKEELIDTHHAQLLAYVIAPTHDMFKYLGSEAGQFAADHEVVGKVYAQDHLAGKTVTLGKEGKPYTLTQEDAQFIAGVIGNHENIYKEEGRRDYIHAGGDVPFAQLNPEDKVKRAIALFTPIDNLTKSLQKMSDGTFTLDPEELRTRFTDLYRRHLAVEIKPEYGKAFRPEWVISMIGDLDEIFSVLRSRGIRVSGTYGESTTYVLANAAVEAIFRVNAEDEERHQYNKEHDDKLPIFSETMQEKLNEARKALEKIKTDSVEKGRGNAAEGKVYPMNIQFGDGVIYNFSDQEVATALQSQLIDRDVRQEIQRGLGIVKTEMNGVGNSFKDVAVSQMKIPGSTIYIFMQGEKRVYFVDGKVYSSPELDEVKGMEVLRHVSFTDEFRERVLASQVAPVDEYHKIEAADPTLLASGETTFIFVPQDDTEIVPLRDAVMTELAMQKREYDRLHVITAGAKFADTTPEFAQQVIHELQANFGSSTLEVSGGTNSGVMALAFKAAREAGATTLGISAGRPLVVPEQQYTPETGYYPSVPLPTDVTVVKEDVNYNWETNTYIRLVKALAEGKPLQWSVLNGGTISVNEVGGFCEIALERMHEGNRQNTLDLYKGAGRSSEFIACMVENKRAIEAYMLRRGKTFGEALQRVIEQTTDPIYTRDREDLLKRLATDKGPFKEQNNVTLVDALAEIFPLLVKYLNEGGKINIK